jgi:hypothetical protein
MLSIFTSVKIQRLRLGLNPRPVILSRPQNMLDAKDNNTVGREIINHKMYWLIFCSIWNVSLDVHSKFSCTVNVIEQHLCDCIKYRISSINSFIAVLFGSRRK